MSPFDPEKPPTPQTMTTSTGVQVTVRHAAPPPPEPQRQPEPPPPPQPRVVIVPPQQSARDRDAFIRQLHAEHGEFIRRTLVAEGVLPESARDLTQEVLLTAWQKSDPQNPIRNVRGWLFTIACHKASNHRQVRRPDIDREADAEAKSSPAPSPEEEALFAERRAKALRYIKDLPQQEREVVQCVDFLKMTYEQIALALECEVSTVGARYLRGCQRLVEFAKESERAADAGERLRPASGGS